MSLSEVAQKLAADFNIEGVEMPDGLLQLLRFQWRVNKRAGEVATKFVAAAAADAPDNQEVLLAAQNLISMRKLEAIASGAVQVLTAGLDDKAKEEAEKDVESEEKTSE